MRIPVRLRTLAPLIGAIGSLAAAPASHADVAVSVSSAPQPVQAIAPDFLGLALEYRTVPQWVGTPSSVNSVFAHLIESLDPDGHPVIRVGGQSGDRSWWPVPGIAKPPGVTYTLDSAWTADAHALAAATGARYMLGIELEADKPKIGAVEARHLIAGIGAANIDDLEIGNEPELFPGVPWYKVLDGKPVAWSSKEGTPVYSRPKSYSVTDFESDYARTAAALPHTVPLAGPDSGNPDWLRAFAAHFLAKGSRVRTLTWHGYGVNNCVHNPADPRFPSVAHLLTTAASRHLTDGVGAEIARAHADGGSFRLDEVGSDSCNGTKGVSDTFASALWVLDALYASADAGVDGVNLHTFPGLSNGLFDFTESRGKWSGDVHPIYYGAQLFAAGAPTGSRLLHTSSSSSGVRSWASRAADGTVRVTLIDDSTSAPATVRLGVAGTAGSGGGVGVVRMTAPSASSTGGVAIGGSSYGASTGTGVLQGVKPQILTASGGHYTVTMPPASAALITLPAPGAVQQSSPALTGPAGGDALRAILRQTSLRRSLRLAFRNAT